MTKLDMSNIVRPNFIGETVEQSPILSEGPVKVAKSMKEGADVAPDLFVALVERGKEKEDGTMLYFAAVYQDGAEDKIGGSGDSGKKQPAIAIKTAITNVGLNPAHYLVDVKVTDVFPPKKAQGHNSDEKLSDADKATARELLGQLGTAIGEADAASVKTREANIAVAEIIRKLRGTFNKALWGKVRSELLKDDTSAAAAMVKDARRSSYEIMFAGICSHTGLMAAMPNDFIASRTVVDFVQATRAQFAQCVIEEVQKNPKGHGGKGWAYKDANGKGVDLSKVPFEKAVTLVTENYVETVTGTAEGFMPNFTGQREGAMADVAKVLIPMHWEALCLVDGDLFSVETKDGEERIIAANTTSTLLGLEGRDELVMAIANAENNRRKAKAHAQVVGGTEDAAKALVKAIAKSGNSFADMDADTAARHLFNILAGKLDEVEREASAGEAQAVLDAMSSKLSAFLDGVSVAELVAEPESAEPASEDDATDEADAV